MTFDYVIAVICITKHRKQNKSEIDNRLTVIFVLRNPVRILFSYMYGD
jgi:hypothetical protein